MLQATSWQVELIGWRPTSTGIRITTNGSTWAQVGSSRNQFVLNQSGLSAIAFDHSGVYQRSNLGLGGTWAQIGSSFIEQLFEGAAHNIAAVDLTSAHDVSFYTSSATWTLQGGAGNMFAVTTDGTLFGLEPARDVVAKSNNTGYQQSELDWRRRRGGGAPC